MDASGVELRAAAPTPEDGVAFARFLDQAPDGLFRTMLGARADDVVARAFVRSGHDLSWEHVTFACRDAVLLGMLSAYTGTAHKEASEDPLLRAAGWRVVRLAVVAFAARPMLRFMEHVPAEDFYVQAVAVDPASRGGGIGTALLRLAEEQAGQAGCSRLCLDVDVENEGAVRLYERRGLAVEGTSGRAFLLGGARVQRMAKALT